MGQTQGRQVGKQDSSHVEYSETPGLSGNSEPAKMSSKNVTYVLLEKATGVTNLRQEPWTVFPCAYTLLEIHILRVLYT